MGIGLFGSDKWAEWPLRPLTNPNPDPANFEILKVAEVGRFLIAEISYPNCTNFEGRKILVYEGITEKELREMTRIDPHFQQNKKVSTVARFIPTKKGWEYAKSFCRYQEV